MRLEVERPTAPPAERLPPTRSLLSRFSMNAAAVARRAAIPSASQAPITVAAAASPAAGSASPAAGTEQQEGGVRVSKEEGPSISSHAPSRPFGRISFAGGLARISAAVRGRGTASAPPPAPATLPATL